MLSDEKNNEKNPQKPLITYSLVHKKEVEISH